VQLFLPRYGQPDADALHNLSTAIIVDQQPLGGNPRSTLGTATDVYTMFRVLFAAGNVVVRHVQEVKLHSRQARAHPVDSGRQTWALPGFRPSVGPKNERP
jgi:excinuclease UvrABC ATPase subunit